jgi:hypothetical protein
MPPTGLDGLRARVVYCSPSPRRHCRRRVTAAAGCPASLPLPAGQQNQTWLSLNRPYMSVARIEGSTTIRSLGVTAKESAGTKPLPYLGQSHFWTTVCSVINMADAQLSRRVRERADAHEPEGPPTTSPGVTPAQQRRRDEELWKAFDSER